MNATLEILRVLPTENKSCCEIQWIWRFEQSAQEIINEIELLENGI